MRKGIISRKDLKRKIKELERKNKLLSFPIKYTSAIKRPAVYKGRQIFDMRSTCVPEWQVRYVTIKRIVEEMTRVLVKDNAVEIIEEEQPDGTHIINVKLEVVPTDVPYTEEISYASSFI